MRLCFAIAVIAFFFIAVHAASALTQPPAPAAASMQDRAIRAFIECKEFVCDNDYLRTEITFVNHVRDRQSADVHVLGTGQPTGGGGRELMLQFIGQQRFAGRTETLRYNVPPNTSEDDTRIGLVRTIKVGLLRFVNETPLIKDVQIEYRPKADEGSRHRPRWMIPGISGCFARASAAGAKGRNRQRRPISRGRSAPTG